MEDALLQSQHLAAELPTSIGALKNHPLYVLERHLGKACVWASELPSRCGRCWCLSSVGCIPVESGRKAAIFP